MRAQNDEKGQVMNPEETGPEWAQLCWDHMQGLVLGSWRLLKAAERDGVALEQGGIAYPTQWWTENSMCVSVVYDNNDEIRYAVGAPDKMYWFADPESALDLVRHVWSV